MRVGVGQAMPPIATHFSIYVGSSDTLCYMGVPGPKGEGRFGSEPLSQKLHLPVYDSPGGSTDQRFCLLPKDFDHLLFNVSVS